MKPYIILLTILISISCASLKTSDNKINWPILIQDASWGIEASCAANVISYNICKASLSSLRDLYLYAQGNTSDVPSVINMVIKDLEINYPVIKDWIDYLLIYVNGI